MQSPFKGGLGVQRQGVRVCTLTTHAARSFSTCLHGTEMLCWTPGASHGRPHLVTEPGQGGTGPAISAGCPATLKGTACPGTPCVGWPGQCGACMVIQLLPRLSPVSHPQVPIPSKASGLLDFIFFQKIPPVANINIILSKLWGLNLALSIIGKCLSFIQTAKTNFKKSLAFCLKSFLSFYIPSEHVKMFVKKHYF